jgi:hypothetical protein
MPVFEITSPDGRTFEITAPDGATREQALAYAQKNYTPKAVEKGPDPSEGGLPFRPLGIDAGLTMPQGVSRFLAGTGKAFTDVARGAGQMIGAVSRDDVAESRRLDKPLMNTGAGTAGNIFGYGAALLPTALIPGANTMAGASMIGAGTGFLAPSASTGETVANTLIGGVAAPLTMAAVRGGQALYQGGKGLMEPLTKAGQERIAADVLRRSATNPALAAQNAGQARQLVPGSQNTLAQVAQDPGLAQLERTILNNPEYAPALQGRFAAQKAARLNAVKDIAGRGDHYDEIAAGRALFAKQDYDAAFAAGVDGDMAKAMQPQIDSLMRRPAMQEAQAEARRLAANSDKTISFGGAAPAAAGGQGTWRDFTAGKMGEYMRSEGGHGGAMKRLGSEWAALKNGAPAAEAAPQQPMSIEALDWMKKALDNKISTANGANSSIGKEELKALVQTKSDLMKTLEQIAPAYKTANDNFAAMSGQLNSMDVGRQLLSKLQKPGSEYSQQGGREMGAAYSGELSKSFDSVKKATGMNKGIEQIMPPRDIAALENVARDIGRKTFAEEAGKATGSNTAQNLASQNMLRRLLGPTGLPESWAEQQALQLLFSPVQMASKLSGADRKIMDRIAQGLLDPVDGIGLLSRPAQIQSLGLLGAPNAQRYIPAGGLLAPMSREKQ